MPNVEYSFDSIKEMLDAIGITPEDQAEVYRTYDPPRIQRHAAQTIFCMHNPDSVLRNPIAWFKASIRGNWKPPPGFDAQQQVMYFRIDEGTWAKMTTGNLCPICAGEHQHKDCPSLKRSST